MFLPQNFTTIMIRQLSFQDQLTFDYSLQR